MSEDIEGRTSSAIAPTGRITWDVLGALRSQPRRPQPLLAEEERAWVPHPKVDATLYADTELSWAEGDSSFSIAPGEFLTFKGATINGPERFDTEFDILCWSLAARGGFWFSDKFGLEGILGASYISSRVEVESPGWKVSDRSDFWNPRGGIQASGRPLEYLTLYGRAVGNWGGSEGYLTELELGASLQIVEHVALLAGWRHWEYDLEGHGSDADVKLRLAGPLIGIELGF